MCNTSNGYSLPPLRPSPSTNTSLFQDDLNFGEEANMPHSPTNYESDHEGSDIPSENEAHGQRSKTAKSGASQAHKGCEVFTGRIIACLLSAVIEVNPFMSSCGQSQSRWKEVMAKAQDAGMCRGRGWDMVCNKVMSLLKWVEVCIHPLAC
jgi:hypothetical protein